MHFFLAAQQKKVHNMSDENLIEDFEKVVRTSENFDGNALNLNIVDFLTQVADTNDLTSIQSIKLKLMTKDLALYNLNSHLPGLKELDLDSSNVHSLRELGTRMHALHVLRLGRCKLTSLDGILAFENLTEFSAPENFISDIGLLGSLSKLAILDISRNQIRHWNKLTFLKNCENLRELDFHGNPGSRFLNYKKKIKEFLPQLILLDGKSTDDAVLNANNAAEDDSLNEKSTDAKIPLGLSTCGRNISMVLANMSRTQSQESVKDIQGFWKLEKRKNPKNVLKAAEKWRADFQNVIKK